MPLELCARPHPEELELILKVELASAQYKRGFFYVALDAPVQPKSLWKQPKLPCKRALFARCSVQQVLLQRILRQ